MKKTALSLVLMTLVVSVSCKKEKLTDEPNCEDQDQEEVETTPFKNIFPMEEGSYWVYNTYIRDKETGAETFEGIDSVVVTGTEFINGESFTVFSTFNKNGNLRNKEYYRDSSGFIIDTSSTIFIANSAGYILFDTLTEWDIYFRERFQLPNDTLIEAGDLIYDARPVESRYTALKPEYRDASLFKFYVDSIGLVRYDYEYAAVPEKQTRKELVSYRLN